MRGGYLNGSNEDEMRKLRLELLIIDDLALHRSSAPATTLRLSCRG